MKNEQKKCRHENATTTTSQERQDFETIIEHVKCDDCGAKAKFIFTLTEENWD